MIKRIKRFKKIRIHREGTDTLLYGFIVIAAIALLLWRLVDNKVPCWCFVVVMATVYGIIINFFRCPIRFFPEESTEKVVVAPADGRVVVIEEVEENEYFHDILCRQIAGAVARRIVTYAKEGEDCYIDEHLGFIKFGSRVDVYLPLGTEVCVKMGQATTGDQTIIAKLK